MKFYIVDAFTEKLFGGNPAGVVIIEGGEFPPFDVMVKTAAELRYSETVFAKHVGGDTWELRYFTPTDEVDLCGHATIAAFSIIGMSEGIGSADAVESGETKKYKAVTKAGEIGIDVTSDLVMMEMATPEIIEEIDNEMKWEATRKILGLEPEKFFGTGGFYGIAPAIVSTGLPDIVFPVDSVDELMGITPDFDAMEKLSDRQKVVGVHAYALIKDNGGAVSEGGDIRIECRNFAPLYGIPEEAATGTANGALTYYLFKKGILKEGVLNEITQGTSMDRPSKIYTLVERDESGNTLIKVGGSAVTLAEGDILL